MHAFAPLAYAAMPAFAGIAVPVLIVAIVWEIVLKGFGLWHAARCSQKWWFVAMLIFNTLGILPIVYLIWFRTDARTPAHESSAAA